MIIGKKYAEFHGVDRIKLYPLMVAPNQQRAACLRLQTMQAELTQACDAIPDVSVFDIEPESSEFPTRKNCNRCGEIGHLARNCFMPFKRKRKANLSISSPAGQSTAGEGK